VLLTLGARSFQRDVTSGIALWCAIQLLLGPLLGGVTAAVLSSNFQFNEFTKESAYFFAGLCPREIVAVIRNAVRRLFSAGQAVTTPKLIPLQLVRGLDERVEERLFEEGITDGYQLAMADPIRLYRNTPFDLRQIVAWIDECLLRATLPEFAEPLQKLGVTGAIDLAYHWEMGKNARADVGAIRNLAKLVNCDFTTLKDTCRRLDEDSQVLLIWALYQAGMDSVD
jgi:hypothetical protein